MTAPIVIRLPGVPRGKGRPRYTRDGKPYTPAKTRSFEGALKLAGEEAMRGRPPLEGPLEVVVVAEVPIPASWSKIKRAAALRGALRPETKPDWDNYAKTGDALNEVVWKDDKLVADGGVHKVYSATPGLTFFVRPAPPKSAADLLAGLA